MWKLLLQFLLWVLKKIQYKRRLEGKIDDIIAKQAELELRTLRLELVSAMGREDDSVVYQLFDEYKTLGGDSWMDDLFLQWKSNKRGRKCRIK